MNVFIVNCGSSSLKYQLFGKDKKRVLAKGLAERIGIDGSVIIHKPLGKEKIEFKQPLNNHKEALDIIFKALTNDEYGVINRLEEIDAIGHRVVLGGEAFTDSVLIDDAVIKKVEEYSDLAPLHNPANLIGIKACQEILPGVPNIGVFDTSFHHTMPKEAYIYPLPYEMYEKYRIRKYGYHGTSHRYVTEQAGILMGEDVSKLKIITCHLGNGASVCAVRYGKSIETSMGLTPLSGLEMGTRCGDIDPAIIPYLVSKGYSIEDVNTIMNKKSGILGVSGISSDFRDVEKAADEGNERAQLALDIFSYTVRHTIGSYVAIMDGVDGIVFTAGVGENSDTVRQAICSGLTYLGIQLDPEKNSKRGEALFISTDDSKTKVMVIPTNEELMIAKDTARLLGKE